MFHVITRFGTTSLVATLGSELPKSVLPGALGPTSTKQIMITAPASSHVPLPNTIASSMRTHTASDVSWTSLEEVLIHAVSVPAARFDHHLRTRLHSRSGFDNLAAASDQLV